MFGNFVPSDLIWVILTKIVQILVPKISCLMASLSDWRCWAGSQPLRVIAFRENSQTPAHNSELASGVFQGPRTPLSFDRLATSQTNILDSNYSISIRRSTRRRLRSNQWTLRTRPLLRATNPVPVPLPINTKAGGSADTKAHSFQFIIRSGADQNQNHFCSRSPWRPETCCLQYTTYRVTSVLWDYIL